MNLQELLGMAYFTAFLPIAIITLGVVLGIFYILGRYFFTFWAFIVIVAFIEFTFDDASWVIYLAVAAVSLVVIGSSKERK